MRVLRDVLRRPLRRVPGLWHERRRSPNHALGAPHKMKRQESCPGDRQANGPSLEPAFASVLLVAFVVGRGRFQVVPGGLAWSQAKPIPKHARPEADSSEARAPFFRLGAILGSVSTGLVRVTGGVEADHVDAARGKHCHAPGRSHVTTHADANGGHNSARIPS